mgnify:CR=1 FL=1
MDKLKVSREKLAFIVDATAAPIAGLACVLDQIAEKGGAAAVAPAEAPAEEAADAPAEAPAEG